MSQSQSSLTDTLQAWNEDGQLYVGVGMLSAVLSLVFVPLFGLVAVYSGFKLYVTQQKTILSFVMAGLGGFGFLFWVYYLIAL